MIVKDLIEILKKMPQDSIVILQKDAEGNGYSPLSCVDSDAIYVSDCSWEGDVYSTNWTADEMCMDEDQWETLKESSPPCVVLAPVN